MAFFVFASTAFASTINYRETIPSIVRLDVVDSEGNYQWGTGFFISSDSFILTNYHVVEDVALSAPADYIDICVIPDEYKAPECKYSGRVLAYDKDRDLALLMPGYAIDKDGNESGSYIGAKDLGFSYVDLSDKNPRIGEDLYILGFPDASYLSSVTLTEGIVSGFSNYDSSNIEQIATDATINPGNSGGPAYNTDERVVGVVTEISTTGVGGNYGYIISNDIIKMWFEELVQSNVLNAEYVSELFSNDSTSGNMNYQTTSTLPQFVFTDVESSNKYAMALMYLKENHVVGGYTDGSFKPYNPISRAELMKILVEGIGRNPNAESYVGCFPDVTDQWFARYVCFAKVKGWISGYSDGTFKPDAKVSKAEAIKMLLEVFEIDVSNYEGSPYSDVAQKDWFSSYIGTAMALGLLEEDGVFYRPLAEITRGQISENLYRIMTMRAEG